MGARKGMALTEVEYIKIKASIERAHRFDLLIYFEIMVKTGIRPSDWSHLAGSYKKHQCQMFEVFIQKQSKLKEGKKPVFVKRFIKLPDMVFKAIQEGTFQLKPYGESWVRQKAQQIQKLIKGEKFYRNISPNDFRHTFVTFCKHRGFDIADVQTVTKHASLDSLMHYFDSDIDLIEQIYDSVNNDRYELMNNPKLLMQLVQRLKAELKYTKAKLKAQEEIHG